MKKIEALVEPFKLNQVKEALGDLGITGLTVSEVRGFTRHEGRSEIYRGSEYTVDLLPKIKLEVVLADKDLEEVVATILRFSNSPKMGPSNVFVLGIDDATLMQTD